MTDMTKMTEALVHELREDLEDSEKKRILLQRRTLMHTRVEPDAVGLWTMLDLMTLLLIFFIYLYASRINFHHTKTFSLPNGTTPIPHLMPREKSDFDFKYMYNRSSFYEVEQELLSLMEEKHTSDVAVEMDQRRLVLVIGEKISFGSGSADLLPEIQGVLSGVAGIINRNRDYRIIVSGHTDDRPIRSRQYPSNWELSAIRAIHVARALIASGVDPSRISVEGFAQFAPKAANTTEDNRRKNRRVEISLIKNTALAIY